MAAVDCHIILEGQVNIVVIELHVARLPPSQVGRFRGESVVLTVRPVNFCYPYPLICCPSVDVSV